MSVLSDLYTLERCVKQYEEVHAYNQQIKNRVTGEVYAGPLGKKYKAYQKQLKFKLSMIKVVSVLLKIILAIVCIVPIVFWQINLWSDPIFEMTRTGDIFMSVCIALGLGGFAVWGAWVFDCDYLR